MEDRTKSSYVRAMLAAAVGGSVALLAAAPASAADVTYQRLLNAANEPQNWLMQWGNYESHNYSTLNQINTSNAQDLQVKFIQPLAHNNLVTYEQFIPIVEDGLMYVGNGEAMMHKFDVRSGNRAEALWIYDPEQQPGGRVQMRSTAVLNDSLYFATDASGRLIRLNKETGEVIFDVNVKSDEEAPLEYGRGPGNDVSNEQFSATVVALEDRIIVQQARSGGWRSWLAAYSADDGELLWRWWAVPGPGAPGHETWTDTWNSYLSGGGSMFNSGSYDPELNLYYVGTGDPSPWGNPEFRPGDNLYTVSTVALNAEDGSLAWYFQEIPNEAWDFDAVGVKQLYDIEVDGQTREVLGTWSRNGYHYTLDRATGEFLFAKPWTEVNWTEGIDPKTGLPVSYDPSTSLQAYNGKSQRYDDLATGQNMCPFHGGNPTFWPPSYDPTTMISYQAGAGGGCADYVVTAQLPEEEHFGVSTGGTWAQTRHNESNGFVKGVNVLTGDVVSEAVLTYPNSNGVLATAGGLLFTSSVDGKIIVLDRDTMAEVWSFNTGKVPNASLMTYMADGKQYVAALLGGRLRTDFYSAGMQAELRTVAQMGEGNPGLLVVFGL